MRRRTRAAGRYAGRDAGPAKAGHYAGRYRRYVVLAATAVLLSSCTSRVDLKQALQVTDVSTGWFDAGVVDGKNKLVPSITFTLRKAENADVSTAALNVVFRYADSGEERDDVFVQRVDFAGNATAPMTVRAPTGYTADPPQSRADMLKHSQFRDMDAEIFVRQSSSQWVSLHKVRVERQLLTR